MAPRNLNLCTAYGLILLVASSITGCGGGGGASSSASLARSTSDGATASEASFLPTCSAIGYVPNYAGATDPSNNKPNSLYHWTGFPVHVYFVPDSELTTERRQQAVVGFDWWGTATGGQVAYRVVDSADQAQIMVRFVAEGANGRGGLTEYRTNSHGEMLSATITFNLTYLSDLRFLPPLAAHEMGHALGIGGHSPFNTDIMCQCGEAYQQTNVSQQDINTLMTAYCSAAGRSRSKKISTDPAKVLDSDVTNRYNSPEKASEEAYPCERISCVPQY